MTEKPIKNCVCELIDEAFASGEFTRDSLYFCASCGRWSPIGEWRDNNGHCPKCGHYGDSIGI